ncbi:MAG TPA: NUDIX hydrolase [Anaerolineales bacterium]|nr:NUDIX hydrolase [Anaerolineales bacterium]
MLNDWIKLSEQPLETGSRRILRRAYRLPDGRESTFDIKHEGCAVCILALTDANQVVMTRQFRPGPEKVLLEMPGGGVEPGEAPEAAAGRELLEETGYAGKLELVSTSLDCAYSTMVRYNFVATHCRPVQPPSPDVDEFIEVFEMPLPDFRQHLRSSQLTDVETGYLGLDYLGLL